MEDPIVNRVEESGLIQVDLGQLLKPRPTAAVDLAEWLDQGIVLREKAFRQQVSEWDASGLEGHVVAMHCSSDAILPDWAWMLVAAKLQSFEAFSLVGTPEKAQTHAWRLSIEALDLDTYRDQRVIVKGCATAGGPATLVAFTQRIGTVVRSLMFGEACSAVPLIKNPKK